MLKKQQVLVTGGASGIGWAVVKRLSAQGLEVTVLDRVDLPEPDLARLVKVDLMDLKHTRAVLEELVQRIPFTRLVNNVGMVREAWLEDTTLEDFRALQDLNQGCALLCTQAVIGTMRNEGFGRIVNMSSRAALGKARRSGYAASKAGLIGLTRTWALELGSAGITVNSVAPGPIATELFNNANPPGEALTQAIVDAVPVGRVGTPDDVAHAVEFLLDKGSGFITGQTLFVCGGMTIGNACA